jgi:hypothetical protein
MVGPRSDRPLRSRLFLSRLYWLTFGWSTRSRLANPFDFPRANDLGMSRLVHLFHQTKVWFSRLLVPVLRNLQDRASLIHIALRDEHLYRPGAAREHVWRNRADKLIRLRHCSIKYCSSTTHRPKRLIWLRRSKPNWALRRSGSALPRFAPR